MMTGLWSMSHMSFFQEMFKKLHSALAHILKAYSDQRAITYIWLQMTCKSICINYTYSIDILLCRMWISFYRLRRAGTQWSWWLWRTAGVQWEEQAVETHFHSAPAAQEPRPAPSQQPYSYCRSQRPPAHTPHTHCLYDPPAPGGLWNRDRLEQYWGNKPPRWCLCFNLTC